MGKRTREQERSRRARWRAKNPKKDMVASAKVRAKKTNLPFSISYKDVIIPDTCPVLGIPLFRGTKNSHDGSPSLDRIVGSKGYVPGNVEVISFRANRIKSNATNEELLAVAKYICKHTTMGIR